MQPMSEDLYGITPYPINLDNGSDVVFQLQLSCYPATSFFFDGGDPALYLYDISDTLNTI